MKEPASIGKLAAFPTFSLEGRRMERTLRFLFFLLLLCLMHGVSGKAQDLDLETLLGRWETPGGNIIEIRKNKDGRVKGYLVEVIGAAAAVGFRTEELVVKDISTSSPAQVTEVGKQVSFSVAVRVDDPAVAATSAPAFPRFVGILGEDPVTGQDTITGRVRKGQFIGVRYVEEPGFDTFTYKRAPSNCIERRSIRLRLWQAARKAQESADAKRLESDDLQERFKEVDDRVNAWKANHRPQDGDPEPQIPQELLDEGQVASVRALEAKRGADSLQQIAEEKWNGAAPLLAQSSQVRCVLTCIRMGVESVTGEKKSEPEVIEESQKHPFPWTIQRGGDMHNIPDVLKAFCVPDAKLMLNQTFSNLASATLGGPVIVGVFIGAKHEGHCIVVDRVRRNPDQSLTIIGRDPLPVLIGSRFEMSEDDFRDRYGFKGTVVVTGK